MYSGLLFTLYNFHIRAHIQITKFYKETKLFEFFRIHDFFPPETMAYEKELYLQM